MRYQQPYGAAADAPYVNGNPAAGVAGSIPPAQAIEHPQREIVAVINAAGMTPNANVLTQLRDAILSLIAGQTTSVPGKALLHYGVASGTANAIVLNPSPAVTALEPGQTVLFVAPADNTDVAVINVSSLGDKPLRRSDGVTGLAPGEVRNGRLHGATYDGNAWRLWSVDGVLPVVYVNDVGTANALSGNGSPSISAWRTGQLFIVKKNTNSNSNTSPTLAVDGLSSKTIRRRDGTAVAAGDLAGDSIFAALYDGTVLRTLGLLPSEVSNAVASAGAMFNIQRFSTTTRVSATGGGGDPTVVWDGFSFNKKSATSVLVAWVSFQSQWTLPNLPATYYRLTSGAHYAEAVVNTPTSAFTIGQGGQLVLSGLPAGVAPMEFSLLRGDSASWATIFNPRTADYVGYAATTTSVITIAEVEL